MTTNGTTKNEGEVEGAGDAGGPGPDDAGARGDLGDSSVRGSDPEPVAVEAECSHEGTTHGFLVVGAIMTFEWCSACGALRLPPRVPIIGPWVAQGKMDTWGFFWVRPLVR